MDESGNRFGRFIPDELQFEKNVVTNRNRIGRFYATDA